MAADMFRKQQLGKPPQRLQDSLRAVKRRYEEGDIVLATRRKPHRTKMVSDAQAQEAADAFVEGHYRNDAWLPYFSIDEVRTFAHHRLMLNRTYFALFSPAQTPCLFLFVILLHACKDHPTLRRLLKYCKVTSKHLWQRAKAVRPKLKLVRVLFKARKSKDQKRSRVQFARHLLNMNDDIFLTSVYLDEAWLVLRQPIPGKGIGEKGDHFIIDAPLPSDKELPKGAQGVLCMFLAVHPILGLIHYELLSPTTKHQWHHRWKVRLSSSELVLLSIAETVQDPILISIGFSKLAAHL
jgi:hypothetical protein